MRLVKDMYLKARYTTEPMLFGLRYGQIREDDLVHNGWWYNGGAQRIGYGDLSVLDIRALTIGLEEDERFVVLNEMSASHGKMDGVDLSAPGPEFVAMHAMVVIAPGCIFWIDQFNHYADGAAVTLPRLGRAINLRRATLQSMLTP